jgi:hypothetical protein
LLVFCLLPCMLFSPFLNVLLLLQLEQLMQSASW